MTEDKNKKKPAPTYLYKVYDKPVLKDKKYLTQCKKIMATSAADASKKSGYKNIVQVYRSSKQSDPAASTDTAPAPTEPKKKK